MHLATKHRFHLCHIGQDKDEAMHTTCNSMFVKERAKIHAFIKSSFDHPTPEDLVAIEHSLNFGQAFYIIGFGNNIGLHQIIAAVLYVMNEEGCYINWLAVTSKSFTASVFGKRATEKPFCGMGLATFLLHMIQLQAAANNCKIDLFLQSNIASEAYIWYMH